MYIYAVRYRISFRFFPRSLNTYFCKYAFERRIKISNGRCREYKLSNYEWSLYLDHSTRHYFKFSYCLEYVFFFLVDYDKTVHLLPVNSARLIQCYRSWAPIWYRTMFVRCDTVSKCWCKRTNRIVSLIRSVHMHGNKIVNVYDRASRLEEFFANIFILSRCIRTEQIDALSDQYLWLTLCNILLPSVIKQECFISASDITYKRKSWIMQQQYVIVACWSLLTLL